MNAKIRAHRILRGLAAYDAYPFGAADQFKELPIVGGGEEIIGRYRNLPGSAAPIIAISGAGIYVAQAPRRAGKPGSSEWKFLPFDSIEGVNFPPKETPPAECALSLRLRGGGSARIPVQGGDGQFRDVFEFGRFLLRCAEDARKKAPPPRVAPRGRKRDLAASTFPVETSRAAVRDPRSS